MLEFIRRQQINYAFKRNKRKHAFHSLKTMKSVLILFHTSDWDEVRLIAEDLRTMHKEVVLWTVGDKDDIGPNVNPSINPHILVPEDMSALSILKSGVKQEFRGLEYDTLMDFTNEEGLGQEVFLYLLATNQAEFCIGNRKHERAVFELTIIHKEGQTIWETYKEMKVYLQKIIP